MLYFIIFTIRGSVPAFSFLLYVISHIHLFFLVVFLLRSQFCVFFLCHFSSLVIACVQQCAFSQLLRSANKNKALPNPDLCSHLLRFHGIFYSHTVGVVGRLVLCELSYFLIPVKIPLYCLVLKSHMTKGVSVQIQMYSTAIFRIRKGWDKSKIKVDKTKTL